ncbi:MAG: hypothetical protein B6I20_01365 [Bacteroidetes bacterium 4572_117]|nr:MAG: hypothetical protein B6I20_01365 [Bacteroidetes bacterium 4572_117]
MFVKDADNKIPYNTLRQPISITSYKDDVVFGIYAFNNRNNTFILAITPGTYHLKIEAAGFKPVNKKFLVKENFYENKKRVINIYLEKE